MKGFLIKNITDTIIRFNVDNKKIELSPEQDYFYSNSLLTGFLKSCEKNGLISVSFQENNIKIYNVVESDVEIKKIEPKPKKNTKKK